MGRGDGGLPTPFGVTGTAGYGSGEVVVTPVPSACPSHPGLVAMALVPSTMVPLGTPLPDLTLPDPHGTPHRLSALLSGQRGLAVLFLSNHCPYVRHLQPILGTVASQLAEWEVASVGIHSNDGGAYPEDRPDEVARVAAAQGYGFPQLIDGDQEAARAFRAACTPDLFLYDGEGALVYRGQLDSSRPGMGDPTGADLLAAAQAVASGSQVREEQHPATGCSIKWKGGKGPGGQGWLV